MERARVGRYSNDPEILRFYVDNVQEAYKKLTELGVQSTGLVYQGGHSVKRSLSHNSIEVSKTLSSQIDKRHISILFNIRAKRLILDITTDKVLGVEALGKRGEKIFIKAKVTILATGGMCSSPELIDRYVPKLRKYSIVDIRIPNTTGDGYQMAMSIGADTTHMHVVTMYPNGIPIKGRKGVSLIINEGIYVNIEGNRFINEIESAPCEIGEKVLLQREKCMFTILDNNMWEKGTIGYWKGRGKGSEIVASMLANKWDLPIFIADTIKELSIKTGIDPDGLTKTVEDYNQCVENGTDLEFNKSKEYLIKIDTPPFVSIKQVLFALHGCGGLRANTRLQILNVYGNVIPSLYGCGEVVGGTTGEVYLTSTHYPVAMAFGYWAGKFAAKEALAYNRSL